MNVAFESFNMDLGDFHGIRTFLTQAFGQNFASTIDAGSIAKLITEELSEDIGTCIKTDGPESDPYGYATVVPLGHGGEAVGMLKRFLAKSCTAPGESQRLAGDLEKKGTSVVFMDRFVNLPADVAGPLYQQLLDDHKNAVKEEPGFRTERVILSTPTYIELESDIQEAQQPASKKSRKEAKAEAETKFYYGESELLGEMCEYSWDYRTDKPDRVADSKRAFGDLGIESGRRVFVLSWSSFIRFVGSIDAYIK